MEVRDKANNSIIARRFVIYDNVSEISLNPEETGKLYVSSANPMSDFKWQTIKNGKYIRTSVARTLMASLPRTHSWVPLNKSDSCGFLDDLFCIEKWNIMCVY